MKNTVDVSIDVEGDVTGQHYLGVFSAKTKLSVREVLKQDELYRSILGADSQNASEDAKRIAFAISYLMMRIHKAPDFWKELEGGMKLEDMNLLIEVNNKVQEEIAKEYKALNDEAAEAEKALKASQATS